MMAAIIAQIPRAGWCILIPRQYKDTAMGPFPHTAPKATITPENPAGTDGFAFVEFASPDPAALRRLFAQMGYTLTARHKTRAVELWQQGDITYILNDDPDSHAHRFAAEHGPCAPSMGWRVVDAAHAYAHAVAQGATPYDGPGKVLDVPAIIGIGGSLIYLTDTSPIMSTRAIWMSGSISTAACSTFARSGFLTSRANLPACIRAL
jgi:4-hydroxyphenylpyruvate dioxygenase-like putative hemolysin